MDCRNTPLLKKIQRLAVIGCNHAGLQIASSSVSAGILTTLVRTTPGSTTETKRKIQSALEEKDAPRAEEALAHLRLASDLDVIGAADLVLDMTTLPVSARQALLRLAERAASKNAILATSASPLLVRQLGFRLQSRENFLGMHFLAPAVLAGLCEVSATDKTKPISILAVMQFLRTIGKLPVFVRGNAVPRRPSAALSRSRLAG